MTEPTPRAGILHILYSLRAEGCPRLALSLLAEEQISTGRRGMAAVAVAVPRDLEMNFTRLGIDVASLCWRPRGFVAFGRQLDALLVHIHPSGIVCYTVGMHVPLAVAAWRRRVPFVLHLGNSPPQDPTARRKISLQMLAGLPFVTGYAACSDHVREESLLAYHLPKRRVVTIPNGIAIDAFAAARHTRAIGSVPLTIGMVGSFEAHKDQTVLIEAVAEIVRRGLKVSLRLIGEGALRGELESFARQLHVENHIQWVGMAHDVVSELSKLDVFAYAVRQDEGLGIALVEALAAGVPVVASDVGACREVLDGGRWGRLIPSRDPSVWADALIAAPSQSIAPLEAVARYDVREATRRYLDLLGDTQPESSHARVAFSRPS